MAIADSINNHLSLSDRVSRFIEESLFDGSIRPGQRINESDIAKRLGISKAPVREALKGLEGDGIVQRIPRRGYFANKVDLKRINDFFEIAFIIEPVVARNALRNRDDRIAESLDHLLRGMERALGKKDFESYRALNTQFHGLFRELNDNEWIKKISEMLSKQTRILTALSLSVPQRHRGSIREHTAIVEAFRKDDAEAMTQAVKKHLKNFRENIIRGFELFDVEDKA